MIRSSIPSFSDAPLGKAFLAYLKHQEVYFQKICSRLCTAVCRLIIAVLLPKSKLRFQNLSFISGIKACFPELKIPL